MGRVQDDPLLQGLGSLLGGWAAGGWRLPALRGEGEAPPTAESKSQLLLHVLSAWLGDRNGETETNLMLQPQPVRRWRVRC